MSIKSQIEEITKSAKKIFLEKTERLFLDRVKAEKKLTKQYKGREIYELLQNIDDAYDNKCGKECIASIELKNDWLVISNYGKPFTIETLQRLCQGNVSGKTGEYIGCKGIGFRSVLNWSEIIEIYSGSNDKYISVRFSRDYASRQYSEICNDEHIKQQANELQQKGFKPEFPIFKAPEYILPIEKEFDTVIRLKIKNNDLIEEIRQSIQNFDKSIILFLPNITKIIFSIDSNANTVIAKERNNNIINIKCNNIEDKFYFSEQKLNLNREHDGATDVKMAVAIPFFPKKYKEYKMYTFFPIMNLSSPFQALLNATFCLNDNRNDLDLSSEDVQEVNKIVLSKLLHFYVDTVVKYIDGKRRLELLQPTEIPTSIYDKFRFNGNIGFFNIENDYINYCSKHPIFYNVNKQFLNVVDKPILLRNIHNSFVGNAFSSVISGLTNDKLYGFARRICNNANDGEAYLLEAINITSENWETNTRINVFKWWCNQGYKKLPKLLRNQRGEFIQSSVEPCFLSGSIDDIPDWANISILHPEDESILLDIYKDEIERETEKAESSKRVLPRLINKNLINLQEQSSRMVMISPINNSIENNYNKALDFVYWLWKIWKCNQFDMSIKDNIAFNLPAADKTVAKAKNLYLGAKYNNVLGAQLFQNINNIKELDYIDFKESLQSEQECFWEDLGVCKYPKLQYKEIERIVDNVNLIELNYINSIKKIHPLNINVKFYKTKLYTIDNIMSIITKAPRNSILKWIFGDENIRRQLFKEAVEPNFSYIEYKPLVQGKRYMERYNNGWKLPSYLRYVFSSTDWLEVNGVRYSPINLVISNDDFISNLGISSISEREIEKIADEIGINKNQLRMFLIDIGVKSSYLDFKSELFYGMLLKISQLKDDESIEKSKRISREIYRSIIENSRQLDKKTEFYSDSITKQEFFKLGKVLAKNNLGKSSYQPVDNVFFSSSATINLNNYFFIDVPTRSGKKEDFQSILNVKSFEQKYVIKESLSSNCNKSFKDDFQHFLPCIMTYYQGKKDKICNLNIELVRSAIITIDGEEKNISDKYTLLRKSKGEWLIYIGNENRYDVLAKEKLAECIEQVFNVFLNFPSKEFLAKVIQLFICSPCQREYFIKSDFGSNEELEETRMEMNDSTEIKKSLKNHLKEILQEEELDNYIDKIDWVDLESYDTQSNIADLLRRINKGTDFLSLLLNRPVSIALYNKELLKIKYEENVKIFQAKVYRTLLESKDKRMSLCKIWDDFTLDDNKIVLTEDINFDPNIIIDELIKRCCDNNHIALLSNDYTFDYIQVYNDNILMLNNEVSEENIKYIDDFVNDLNYKSLLFFNSKEDILQTFNEFIGTRSKIQDTSSNSIDLQHLLNNTEISDKLNEGELPTPIKKSAKKSVSAVKKESSNKRQRNQGDLAEYLVIIKLANREIKEVLDYIGNDYMIRWKSSASNRIKRLQTDIYRYDITESDDSAGYDIEVVSKDYTKKIYIEVKSSSSDECSFIMSRNEYEKAKSLSTSNSIYRVVFVSCIDLSNPNTKPKMTFINDNIFDENNFFAIPMEYNIVYNRSVKLSI